MIVILGGGITGLAAANVLAGTGEECLVVEKEEKPGGHCRSIVAGLCVGEASHVKSLDRWNQPQNTLSGGARLWGGYNDSPCGGRPEPCLVPKCSRTHRWIPYPAVETLIERE